MKKNQIFKLLLVLFAINPYFQIQLNAENLMDQFDSQENATWDKAKYEKITKNDKGVITIYRYFIDKNSNIYRFYKVGNKNIIGPDKIGNLKKSEISTGNTCVFGTNVQCLTNITKTTTQFAVQNNELYQFKRTDMVNSGTKGDVKKSLLAGPKTKDALQKIIAEGRKEAEQLITKGSDLLNKEDYVNAYKLFNKAIKADNNSYLAYAYRGIAGFDCYVERENTGNRNIFCDGKNIYDGGYDTQYDDEDALKDFKKSLSLKPNKYAYEWSGVVNYYIAQTQQQYGRDYYLPWIKNTCEDLSNAYKYGSDDAKIYFEDANCKKFNFKLVSRVEEAKKQDKVLFAKLILEANESYRDKNYTNALNQINKAIKIQENFSEELKKELKVESAFYMRGITQYVLQNYDQTINDLNKVIEINPKDSNAFLYKGMSQIILSSKNKDLLPLGCKNTKKAISLGNKNVSQTVKDICSSIK